MLQSMKTCTTAQAARAAGVSRATLQVWIKGEKIKAPKTRLVGGTAVRLWSKADIERARRFKGTLKRGPRANKKKK
jgi:DNA-binding transcriptional MerR regulator